jgi:hypothetical protein
MPKERPEVEEGRVDDHGRLNCMCSKEPSP